MCENPWAATQLGPLRRQRLLLRDHWSFKRLTRDLIPEWSPQKTSKWTNIPQLDELWWVPTVPTFKLWCWINSYQFQRRSNYTMLFRSPRPWHRIFSELASHCIATEWSLARWRRDWEHAMVRSELIDWSDGIHHWIWYVDMNWPWLNMCSWIWIWFGYDMNIYEP